MWLLKECSDLLSPFMALCITRHCELALHCIALFKTSVVTPVINKTGMDANAPQNYRPISNLPFISKLLERVVSNQI